MSVFIILAKIINDMVKKGKYKLFNYLIENNLIYYKSIRKNDKIVAFAILVYKNSKSILSVLNEFLRKRIIQYYAIQINTHENCEKLLFLNFEDSKKERIIKSFNFIQQNIFETHNSAKFLKEKDLEAQFLSNLSQEINSNSFITKSSESIKISNDNNSKVFSFFLINLDFIKKKKSFILDLLNLIKNLGSKGFLILNFKTDNNDNIKISFYFVEECENIENTMNLENNINDFFQSNLIKKQDIKIRTIFNYLWRLEIKDSFYFLNDFLDLFFHKTYSTPFSLSEINKKFEQNLLNNKIEYVRLGDNLIFIEHSYLFIILENIDSKYILRILKKYYPKYIIYILILNELGYKKLIEAKSIKLMENIKIIHPKDIQKFNCQEFKSNYYLKNT